MFSFLEYIILSIYFTIIFVAIMAIQVLNPGKAIRETFEVQETNEKFVQAEFEEPSSESEQSESEEEKTLRQRRVQTEVPWIEQVD